VKASTATVERTLLGLTFWSKRQDAAPVAALVRGLTDEERAECLSTFDLPGVARSLYDMGDDELAARMLALGGKTMPLPAVHPQHKVLAGAGKSAMAPPRPTTDLGTFTGYLAVLGNRDDQGDTLLHGSMDDTLADFKAGARRWLLTDAHSEKASDVVAEVADAALDGYGLKVWGRWMPTERAQQLRQMVRQGARLGLSIDYLAERARPDGAGGRALVKVAVFGGAVTPKPANGLATILEGKTATVMEPAGVPVVHAWSPVVTVEQEIEQGRARRDPDRDRLRRMVKALEGAGWPPPELVAQLGIEAAFGLLEGAAKSAVLRQVSGDPERKAAQERRDRLNEESWARQDWQARNAKATGCGYCHWCRHGAPLNCVYR
jgi:HK97 family phage prohead protease